MKTWSTALLFSWTFDQLICALLPVNGFGKAMVMAENAEPKRRKITKKNGMTLAGGVKVDRRRAPETRTRILDAAEELFANQGYYGSSLRDITKVAGVRLALLHYHFGTKEDLIAAVINRRAAENADDLDAALAAALAAPGSRQNKREAIIRAFIAPVVEKALHRGKGWSNYIRLMGHTANMPQEEQFMAPFRVYFDGIVRNYVTALVDLHPELTEADIHWCFFFYQAAITHIITQSQMLDRQSEGRLKIHDLEAVVDHIVPFFSAGFAAFCK